MQKLKSIVKVFFLRLLTPFQIILQRIGRQESLISHIQVNDLVSKIEPGDFLLSFEYGRPTSILIKGYYDHAAIVSSSGTVVEAVGDLFIDGRNRGGVREVDLAEWIYKKDSVAVVRPRFEKSIRNEAGLNALKYIGKGYDYQFTIDDETVYCAELNYLCYRKLVPNFMNHIGLYDEILPQEYYNLALEKKGFDLVAEFKNKRTFGLADIWKRCWI